MTKVSKPARFGIECRCFDAVVGRKPAHEDTLDAACHADPPRVAWQRNRNSRQFADRRLSRSRRRRIDVRKSAIELGAGRSGNAMIGPRPAVTLEEAMLARMPIACCIDGREFRHQRIDRCNHTIAAASRRGCRPEENRFEGRRRSAHRARRPSRCVTRLRWAGASPAGRTASIQHPLPGLLRANREIVGKCARDQEPAATFRKYARRLPERHIETRPLIPNHEHWSSVPSHVTDVLAQWPPCLHTFATSSVKMVSTTPSGGIFTVASRWR